MGKIIINYKSARGLVFGIYKEIKVKLKVKSQTAQLKKGMEHNKTFLKDETQLAETYLF